MNPYLIQRQLVREALLCYMLLSSIGVNALYAHLNDGQSEFMDRKTLHLAMVYYAIVRISRFYHQLTRFER